MGSNRWTYHQTYLAGSPSCSSAYPHLTRIPLDRKSGPRRPPPGEAEPWRRRGT